MKKIPGTLLSKHDMKNVKGGIAFPTPELFWCYDNGQLLGYVCVTLSAEGTPTCRSVFNDPNAKGTDSRTSC